LFSTTAAWFTRRVLLEDAKGKRDALPSHLERPVRIVVKLDVLSAELLRHGAALKDDLLAVVGQGKLVANVSLLTVAENILQP
jgi:hypothetical protein